MQNPRWVLLRSTHPTRVTRGKLRRGLAQPLGGDAARAREVTHGKLERLERHVIGEVFVPGAAGAGRLDELLDDWPARLLEGGQRLRQVARVRCERAVERDRILHGEAGTGADRE